MPTYEFVALYRTMPRNDLAAALKRTATLIFGEGGIIRKISNLGHGPTPYKISVHGKVHKDAHFFIMEFDCPTLSVGKLKKAYGLDSDFVRSSIFLPVKPIVPKECTLDIELRPAPFRPEVKEMLKIAQRKQSGYTKKIKPQTGLDFEPFPS